MATKEKTLLSADSAHITVAMLVALQRADRAVQDPKKADAKRETLIAGVNAWCEVHNIDCHWTDKAGRKTKGRMYRVCYNGEDTEAAQEKLLDALDAEIDRLMML